MGRYVKVTKDSGPPQKLSRGEGTGALICRDDETITALNLDANPFQILNGIYPNDYERVSQFCKDEIDLIMGNDNTSRLWVYMIGSGQWGTSGNTVTVTKEGMTPIPDGKTKTFRVAASPIEDVTALYIKYTDSDSYNLLDAADYDVNESNDVKDGSITFTGSWLNPDSETIEYPPGGSKLFATYTKEGSAFRTALSTLLNEDIQFMSLGFDPRYMTQPYTYSGISLRKDYQTMKAHVVRASKSAKYMHFMCMLPQAKDCADTDTDYGDPTDPRTFDEWSTSLMNHERIFPVATCGIEDASSSTMGSAMGTPIQNTMQMNDVNLAISKTQVYDEGQINTFKMNQINAIDRIRENNYSVGLAWGMTSDTSSKWFKKLEISRVFDTLSFRVEIDIANKLANNKITMDKQGCKEIRKIIGAILYDMKSKGQIESYPSNHTFIPFEEWLADGSDEAVASVANAKAAFVFAGIITRAKPFVVPEELQIEIGVAT